jgi:hypothetical protein
MALNAPKELEAETQIINSIKNIWDGSLLNL